MVSLKSWGRVWLTILKISDGGGGGGMNTLKLWGWSGYEKVENVCVGRGEGRLFTLKSWGSRGMIIFKTWGRGMIALKIWVGDMITLRICDGGGGYDYSENMC